MCSVNRCERCKIEFGKDVHDIEVGNWDPSKARSQDEVTVIGAITHICESCYQRWSEIFAANFGKSVQQPDYEKCFSLFTEFMKEGDVFVLS